MARAGVTVLHEVFVSEHVGMWRRTHHPHGIGISVWSWSGRQRSVSNQCDPQHLETALEILAMQLRGLTLQRMRVGGWLRGWEEVKGG